MGDTSLPVGSYDEKWDGGKAADNIFTHFTDATGKVDTASVAKGFLWQIPGEPADLKVGYSLPFADIVNGVLTIIPSGVQATAGGHGVGQLKGASPEEINAIKAKIGELYAKIQEQFPNAPANPFI